METLFPPEVVALRATLDMWEAPLHPDEEACLHRVVPKRLREFRAGRACARAALARLGITGFPLLVGPDRAPIWPEGVAGSLAHCGDYCGVVVARATEIRGLGFDVEPAEPLEPGIIGTICTPAEIPGLTALPGLPADLWPHVIFCAKESYYKCWYPLTRRFLDFHDVEVMVDPRGGTFTARLVADLPCPAGLRDIVGRYAIDSGRVYTGVTLPARA